MTRVVVFGASGVQGAAQVAALSSAGHQPVAVSRDPKDLSIDGRPISTAAADFADAQAISRALQDAEVVFLNLPSTSFQPAEPIIAAARLIGKAAAATPSVKLLVFNTSMPVPEVKRGIEAPDDRVDMRAALRDAGVPVISIQPVVFIDNLLEGWAYPPIAEEQTLAYCHKPDLEVSWISHHDVALLMIAAMDKPHLAGRNIAVGGPETVCLSQLAEKLSRAWDRPLACRHEDIDDFAGKIGEAMANRAGLDRQRVTRQMQKAYRFYNQDPSEPFKVDMGPVLQELGAEMTTIEQWGKLNKTRLPPRRNFAQG